MPDCGWPVLPLNDSSAGASLGTLTAFEYEYIMFPCCVAGCNVNSKFCGSLSEAAELFVSSYVNDTQSSLPSDETLVVAPEYDGC